MTQQFHGMDKNQFEQLFKLHYVHLCNFARQFVYDEDSAQDICQKVFVKLWEKRAGLDGRKSLKSYLFTSVKNRCLNHIRDNKKYRSRFLDVDCGDIEIATEDNDQFAEQVLQEKIDTVLNSLPPKCRQVFEMSRYEDKKYREIAEELNVSQKTVEAHMTKAMKLFRAALASYLVSLLILMMLTGG